MVRLTMTKTTDLSHEDDDEPPSRQSLFDKAESSSDSSSSSSDEEINNDNLHIDRKFAKNYMLRKQREELRRVEQQQQHHDDDDDASSSSSESEDEDGELLTPSLNVDILKTIHALRAKDDRIYDSSKQFYDAPETANDNEEQQDGTTNPNDQAREKEPRRHKPKRFKDVIREQILEQMNEDEHKDQDEQSDDQPQAVNRLVYDQEQQSLRAAFLESTNQTSPDEDEQDWMTLKNKGKAGESFRKDVDNEEAERLAQELQVLEATKASELKDPRGEVKDGEQFLLDFIKNKKWIDRTEERESSDDDIARDDDDDSIDQLEQTDDFEAKYNFRFEEAAAEAAAGASGADHSMIGYARSGTMNTLRRKDESRKQKRLERTERKSAERRAKEEQLRRLKNAKRNEMEGKLKQIKSVLGTVDDQGVRIDEATLMKLVEGDYDPDKFEALMKDTYGDEYYTQPDAEWKTDTDVRASLLEDEDGQLLVGQDNDYGGLYDNREDDDVDYDNDEQWGEEDDDNEDLARVGTDMEETNVEKTLREKMQEELYRLDYEDIVAGMPTRFKYRKVEPNNYGLSTEEILFARDSTLKSFVSLKKMAPYREEGEYYVGGKKRRKFRELLKDDVQETKAKSLTKQTSEESEQLQPKRKRRRQKGGKKVEATQQHDGGPDDVVVVSRIGGIDDNKHSSEKQTRKKRGTKRNSEATVVKQSEVAEDAMKDKVDKKMKKIRFDKNHNGRRTKKKKPISVEGVSASRLASYGM